MDRGRRADRNLRFGVSATVAPSIPGISAGLLSRRHNSGHYVRLDRLPLLFRGTRPGMALVGAHPPPAPAANPFAACGPLEPRRSGNGMTPVGAMPTDSRIPVAMGRPYARRAADRALFQRVRGVREVKAYRRPRAERRRAGGTLPIFLARLFSAADDSISTGACCSGFICVTPR